MRKRRLVMLVAGLIIAGSGSVDSAAADEGDEAIPEEEVIVYLTEAQALAEAFPDADSIWCETWALTPAERQRLEERLGWRLEEPELRIHRGAGSGRSLGYAVIGEEIGLYRPITFLVKIDEHGKVEKVAVMVYRESRGGEIRRKRFLRQYEGKDVTSPIRLNRDIVPITGATVSVRSLSAGVRKALAVVHARYFERDGAAWRDGAR